MRETHRAPVWSLVLASLAVALLAYAVKNFLVFLVIGTDLCPHLCPSVLGNRVALGIPLLGTLFSLQSSVSATLQAAVAALVQDRFNLATALLFAPILEEALYRGPLYLARGMRSRVLWWSIGLALTAVFALSHQRSGLALLPLMVLGICSLWLISRTGRFWPSLVLHLSYNFIFASVLVYRSIWAGD